MKKSKLIAGIFMLAAILGLNGCGSGGNVNNNGNTLSSNSTLKPQAFVELAPKDDLVDNSHLNFTISNQSDHVISYVLIKSEDGSEIYNGKFSCGINKLCSLKVDKQQVSTDLTFELLGDNNTVVSASIWLYGTSGNSFRIYANNTMLGVYLFNQLKVQNMADLSKHDTDELASKLVRLFGVDDFFEALAIDYKIAVLDNGLDKEQFYNKLNAEMASGVLPLQEQLPINHFAHVSFMSADNNHKDYCDVPQIGSALGLISNVSRLIPPPGGTQVSIVFGLGQTAITEACKSDPLGSIQKSVDALNGRLDEIDIKIKTLQYGLDDLKNIINETAIQGIINNFDRQTGLLKQYTEAYLGAYNTESENVGYTSLLDFVNKNGGIKKVYDLDNNRQVQNALTSTGEYLSNYELLISSGELSQLSTHLENLCRDQTKIAGDAIEKRIKCDLVISRLVTKANILARETKLAIRDIIDTALSASDESGELDQKWLNTRGIKFDYNKPWQGAREIVESKVDTKLKDVENILVGSKGDKLFDPLANFPDDLRMKIKNGLCYIHDDLYDHLLGVVEWHANPGTPVGPYVVTNCYDGKSFVKSPYYYNVEGNSEISNILGMLLPKSFTQNKLKAGSITLYNSPYVDRTDPLQLSVFNLNSETPLKVNARNVRTFDPLNFSPPYYMKTPSNSFIFYDGEAPLVYPAYHKQTYGGIVYMPLAGIGNNTSYASFDKYSYLLSSLNNSKTQFTSKIYNSMVNDATKGVRPSVLDETVYLSAEKNGYTYVFGLNIMNYSQSRCSSYTCIQHNVLQLVCLSNTICKVDPSVPTRIVWNDGTFANIEQVPNQPTNTIKLSFGKILSGS
ncbi:MAG: hypothetical protein K0R14_884 [Burkholderiales bacterium]|nr:hypothetical protein [Burkholderiales bacterium]